MEKAACRKIIVALDFDGAGPALAMADRLEGLASFYKVGFQLYLAEGPRIIRALRERGARVFLDLKFLDIPRTMAAAARRAVGLEVEMFNLHLLAGREALRAAGDACREESARLDRPPPLVIGVTALTSSRGEEWAELGFTRPVPELSLALAQRAWDCRLDGVVASGLDAPELKRRHGRNFLVVSPGIRGRGSDCQDQARVLSPGEAVARGSDFLVIGRPVTAAPDPAAALQAILKEINAEEGRENSGH